MPSHAVAADTNVCALVEPCREVMALAEARGLAPAPFWGRGEGFTRCGRFIRQCFLAGGAVGISTLICFKVH